jgi:hypothetical protein
LALKNLKPEPSFLIRHCNQVVGAGSCEKIKKWNKDNEKKRGINPIYEFQGQKWWQKIVKQPTAPSHEPGAPG